MACAACYSRLKTANHEIARDAKKREWLNAKLLTSYDGSTPVKHLLEILRDDIGFEGIEDRVVMPLSGLRVAAYYGCLLLRPPSIMRFDDPENPTLLDNIIAATDAEPVDWSAKSDCCGASFSITKPEIVLRLSSNILRAAKEAGADCIVAACPLCQLNLDMRQRDIERKTHEQFRLPVLYFTQLLGLALGLPERDLGLRSLFVDPKPLLLRKSLMSTAKAVPR